MASLVTTPTLASSWSIQSGCTRTNDYWIWEYDAKAQDARTVLGGPTQTTACLPPSWTEVNGAFIGSECPSEYTSACQDSDGAVTCCPTVYDFTCQTPGASSHGSMFRCASAFSTNGTLTVTRTDFAVNTITFDVVTARTDLHLFALAVVYATETSTISGTISSTSSNSAESTSMGDPSALSAGAAAGVGVGATIGFIGITLLGWFALRRRRSKGGLGNGDIGGQQLQYQNTGSAYHGWQQQQAGPGSASPAELGAQTQKPVEMGTSDKHTK
ncbi:uncharacterized protein BCR38DRAFT_488440 [Pseudomassariella vexata]|uniref:Mid2 domain-containing protein n=1 Tax=Pseudomassariella vexata TaxID=1141098 RepID=A0A1Y2DLX5_9PEZI|nr:uncharacterized protein BCR38DRAFT_488440 [Pseudomassariella vexata]ORY60260.1 hypothetical protein BCR38DRAFT_488440 [Pseudomassariella vexata]